jgi:hypothetical protein
MTKVIPRNHQSSGTASVKCISNNPTQLIGGPGSTGKKLPSIPMMMKTTPIKVKNMSISYF